MCSAGWTGGSSALPCLLLGCEQGVPNLLVTKECQSNEVATARHTRHTPFLPAGQTPDLCFLVSVLKGRRRTDHRPGGHEMGRRCMASQAHKSRSEGAPPWDGRRGGALIPFFAERLGLFAGVRPGGVALMPFLAVLGSLAQLSMHCSDDGVQHSNKHRRHPPPVNVLLMCC